jgi:hypothetical protein
MRPWAGGLDLPIRPSLKKAFREGNWRADVGLSKEEYFRERHRRPVFVKEEMKTKDGLKGSWLEWHCREGDSAT